MLTGTCNCGGVQFTVAGTPPPASICHCGQCRKQSGHVWASTFVPQSDLTLTSDTTLAWYAASPIARRGFCRTCGAFLFWQHNDEDTISFALGAIASPSGLSIARHIFVADKGDYYDITDGLPQSPQ